MVTENSLVARIKSLPSLKGIADSVVATELRKYLTHEKILLENLSDKDSKIIVKDLRQKLRRLAGSFQYSQKESKNPLEAHASTKERLEFYPELKNKIAMLKVKSILDLGCGVNPLALATHDVKYYAYDINEHDLELVETFFKENNITGEVKVVDLRNESKLPEVDLCILFKVLDVLDVKNHKTSEALLKRINAKHLLISFSTKTLSGAPMRHPQRGWIEHLLVRLGWSFEQFSSKNEIFYLAAKI